MMGVRRARQVLQVLPVQSVAVGSEKQSWIVFKLVVRELQVVPSHLAANTKTNINYRTCTGGADWTGLPARIPGRLEAAPYVPAIQR